MSEKNKYRIVLLISVLIFVSVYLFELILRKNGYILGVDNGDNLTQHYTFLDNMRINFKATGDIFPQLNMNLGLMSSFVNYTYHWAFNFWTYLSFLYPGSTISYFSVILALSYSIFFVGLFKLLSYYSKEFKTNIVVALLITFSAVFLANHEIQIIYVLGLPFIPWLLTGCHRMLNEEKSDMFIISFCLVIFSSFNLLLSAGFVSIIYIYIINHYSENKMSIIKLFLKLVRNYIIIIFITAIVTIPLLLRILDMSRAESFNDNMRVIDWLINRNIMTDLNLTTHAQKQTVFGASILGSVAILYNILVSKNIYRILGFMVLILMLFPAFSYLFNFLQYPSSKSMITLLPILGILVLNLLTSESKHKIKLVSVLSVFSILFIPNAINLTNYYFPRSNYLISYAIINAIIIYIIIILYQYKTKACYVLIIVFIIFNNYSHSVFSNYSSFKKATMSKSGFDEKIYQNALRLLNYHDSSTINKINTAYGFSLSAYSSIQTPAYRDFFYDTIPLEQCCNDNYVIYQKNTIYNIIFGVGNSDEEKMSFPIIRGTYDIYSKLSFEELPFLNKATALLSGTFVEDESRKYNQNLKIKTKNDFIIKLPKEKRKDFVYDKLDLEIPNEEGVLLVDFDISETSCKNFVGISINDKLNKRHSCTSPHYNDNNNFSYLINLKKDQPVKMKVLSGVGKNKVIVKKFNYSFISKKEILSQLKDISRPYDTKIDLNNSITTNLDMKENGYLETSIPYDNGFKLYVDGKDVKVESINKGFVGAPLTKGKHNVKLVYEIPGFKISQVLGLIGIISLISLIIYEKRRNIIKIN